MTRVLVVDDEPDIVRTMAITLRARRFVVDLAATGAVALQMAAANPPDLVLLDLGLPDLDGLDVIGGLRGWTSAPIVVLSGRSDSADKVAALDAGADDYVTKPFGMDELLARMRAAFRRSSVVPDAPTVRFGDVVVNLAGRTVQRAADGTVESVRLTPTEWQLLELLVRHPGKLLQRRFLVREIWGPAARDGDESLRACVARLRRKLEPEPTRPRHIVTDPGMGYRFQP